MCVFYVMGWLVVMCGTNKTAWIGALHLMDKYVRIGTILFEVKLKLVCWPLPTIEIIRL
jgi:hypothetical protein